MLEDDLRSLLYFDSDSMTVGGECALEVEYDGWRFILYRFCETSVGDLFFELEYWPKTVIWQCASESLKDAVAALASVRQIDQDEALAWVEEKLEWERSTRSKWSQPSQDVSIRLPVFCPCRGKVRDGAEFRPEGEMWRVNLYCDGDLHECDLPGIGEGLTLEEAYEADYGLDIPWTLEELKAELLADDPKWQIAFDESEGG